MHIHLTLLPPSLVRADKWTLLENVKLAIGRFRPVDRKLLRVNLGARARLICHLCRLLLFTTFV